MAIAPITGMLRRQAITDLSLGIGLGLAAASYFWYGYHMRTVRKRDNFYAKLEEERAQRLKSLEQS